MEEKGNRTVRKRRLCEEGDKTEKKRELRSERREEKMDGGWREEGKK